MEIGATIARAAQHPEQSCEGAVVGFAFRDTPSKKIERGGSPAGPRITIFQTRCPALRVRFGTCVRTRFEDGPPDPQAA
jgi:hypothetical protein